ncbi:hypothetical protein TMatcc_007065 [Talaromyces marneffei ATCC 18224]
MYKIMVYCACVRYDYPKLAMTWLAHGVSTHFGQDRDGYPSSLSAANRPTSSKELAVDIIARLV